MKVVTIDAESFWSPSYSLTRMSPLEYVMGDQFELQLLSIKVDDWPTDVFFGDDPNLYKAIRKFDWSQYAICGHGMSSFDAYILAYRLGIRPRLWMCTLAMARPIHAKTTGLSLRALVEHYGLGKKNNAALVATRGKRLADFTPAERESMAVYNRDDTDQCRGLFHILKPHYTASELWQIDAITRMRTEPRFQLDTQMLEVAASIERDRKYKSLLSLGKVLGLSMEQFMEPTDIDLEDVDLDDIGVVDLSPTMVFSQDKLVEAVRTELASAPKFAALLERLGVEVPMKASPTDPEKTIPALSKTDEAFIALQGHSDPVVAAAARARLDVKSTLLETRIQKFLTAGRLAGGMLPVPLRYCGADTTGRDSGEEYNCFTGDVEVLTPCGWVRFDAWAGQPIMQWWPNGSMNFCDTPSQLMKPHEGEIVDVDAVLFSAAMTPDHRLVSMRAGRAVERTAGWVAEHSGLDGVPTGGVWGGTPTSVFTPDQVRLLVAIAADGCVVPRKTEAPTVQIGLRRARKIERLRALLDAVGCEYHVREYPPQVGHVGGHNTQQFVLPRCEYSKGFGPWVLQLSREALDALVDELPHWDGWRNHRGDTEFSTSDREQAKWVATAVHLSGKATTIRAYASGRLQLHVRESKFTTISTREHVRVGPFVGQVYCAGVDSSYILIRRRDKIAVAGQCQNLPRIGPTPKPTDALRRSLRAPAGHKVIVADQSGIELRVNHFLWKVPFTMEVYAQDPDADLYRAAGARALGVAPEDLTKAQRQFEKVKALGLGFGAGAKTFVRVARAMGGLDLTEDEAYDAVTDWRAAHSEIVGGWDTCSTAIKWVAQGRELDVDPWGLVHTCAEGLVLPSGRKIRYPDLREEDDGKWPDGRPKRSWFYGQGRHKARITGPKMTENCLAEGTKVLTQRGWVEIENVLSQDRVHDGVEFVPHGGCVSRFVQTCVRVDGVWMTPDHKVLTNDGWKEARQDPRPYRPDLRHVDGVKSGWAGQQKTPRGVDLPLHVRAFAFDGGGKGNAGVETRRDAELRVRDEGFDRPSEQNAWHVEAPRVRRLAVDVRPLSPAIAQGVQELRRAWDRSLHTVGRIFRALLGRHGAVVSARARPGSQRQRRPILTGELPVGVAARKHHEQEVDRASCGCTRAEPNNRHQPVDPLLPCQERLAGGPVDGATVASKPVYDILNCGPRRRFVVRGDRDPFIVHNCVQALARDSIFDCAVEFYRQTRLRPALRVHDELVYVVPEAEAEQLLTLLQSIMRTPPKWWLELIVWSEGDVGDTYADAK